MLDQGTRSARANVATASEENEPWMAELDKVDEINASNAIPSTSLGAVVNAVNTMTETVHSLSLQQKQMLEESDRARRERRDASRDRERRRERDRDQRPSRNDKRGGKATSFSKKNVECFYCKKRGHFRKDCWKWKAQHKDQDQKDGSRSEN